MKKTFKLLASVIALVMVMTLASSAYVLMENCDVYQVDDTPEWSGTFADLSTDNPPEGTGYIYAKASGGLMIVSKGYDSIDFSEYTEGYVYLDIYVEDITAVTSGCFELYSNSQVSGWNLLDIVSESGWNHVVLKMAEAAPIAGGGFDFAEFTTTRVYAYTSSTENALGVDNFGIGMTADGIDMVIDNCDSLKDESDFTGNSWGGSNNGLVTVESHGEGAVKEGVGCVSAVDKNTVIVGAELETPIDLSEYDPENTYFMFWLYISDAYGTSLGGNVEIGSTGLSLEDSSYWRMTELSYITDGWNPVALRLADLTPNLTGEVDLSHVDAFRVFDFVTNGDEVEIRIDEIGFGTYEEAVERGFIVAEETEESTEEATEEATEEVTEEATEEATEEVTETEELAESAESASNVEETTAAQENLPDTGNDAVVIALCIIAAIVIIAVIAIIVVKKKK